LKIGEKICYNMVYETLYLSYASAGMALEIYNFFRGTGTFRAVSYGMKRARKEK